MKKFLTSQEDFLKLKKNNILKLPKIAQHYVKSLLTSDKHKKHNNIVEEIIKEKMSHGKKGKMGRKI